MTNTKQQVELLLHKLPENCSLEDIQYHLYMFWTRCDMGWRMRASMARSLKKKWNNG
jgi:hypothetical protein